MALLLPKSAFLHIPKTGGKWVTEVLQKSGLVLRELKSTHPSQSLEGVRGSIHCVPTFDEEFRRRRHVFCFVRHPLTWYQSYWTFKEKKHYWNIKNNRFDALCHSPSFEEFIEKMLRSYRWGGGFVTKLYQQFTPHATTIGRQEDLCEDLIRILVAAGEEFDPEIIRASPPRNVASADTSYTLESAYGPDLARRVARRERKIIEAYDYEPIPGRALAPTLRA